MSAVLVRLFFWFQELSEVLWFVGFGREQRREELWPMGCAKLSRMLAGRKHAAPWMELALSSLDSLLLSVSNVIPILTHTATFPMYSNIFCIVAEGLFGRSSCSLILNTLVYFLDSASLQFQYPASACSAGSFQWKATLDQCCNIWKLFRSITLYLLLIRI
jgi:hypothetical protein